MSKKYGSSTAKKNLSNSQLSVSILDVSSSYQQESSSVSINKTQAEPSKKLNKKLKSSAIATDTKVSTVKQSLEELEKKKKVISDIIVSKKREGVAEVLTDYCEKRGFCSGSQQFIDNPVVSNLLKKRSDKQIIRKLLKSSAAFVDCKIEPEEEISNNSNILGNSDKRDVISNFTDVSCQLSREVVMQKESSKNLSSVVSTSFKTLLLFIDQAESVISKRLSSELHSILSPLLIWLLLEMLENGCWYDADDFLTQLYPEVKAMCLSNKKKSTAAIESIFGQLRTLLLKASSNNGNSEVFMGEIAKLKLLKPLFVTVSARCRDFIIEYLRRQKDSAVVLRCVNLFVSVRSKTAGKDLLSLPEEEEDDENNEVLTGSGLISSERTLSDNEALGDVNEANLMNNSSTSSGKRTVSKKRKCPSPLNGVDVFPKCSQALSDSEGPDVAVIIDSEKKISDTVTVEDGDCTNLPLDSGSTVAVIIKEEKADVTSKDQFVPSNEIGLGLRALSALPSIVPSVVRYFHCSGAGEPFHCADISDDCRSLAVGCDDNSLQIWQLNNSRRARVVSDTSRVDVELEETASTSQFSYDGSKNIFKRTGAPTVGSPARHTVRSATLRGHSGSVYCVRFLNDDSCLNLNAESCQTDFSGHLLSSSHDGTARLFNLALKKNVYVYPVSSGCYPVWEVDMQPSNCSCEYFATASFDHTARIFNFDRLHPLRIFAGHSDSVDCIRWHGNGKYFGTASSDRTARLWAFNEAKPVRLFYDNIGQILKADGGAIDEKLLSGTPTCLRFSNDGRRLAIAHAEAQMITLWDIGEQRLLQVICNAFDGPITTIAFNCDDSSLASGSQDGVVRLWDIKRTQSTSYSNEITSLSDSLPSADIKNRYYSVISDPVSIFRVYSGACVLNVKFSVHNRLIAVGSSLC